MTDTPGKIQEFINFARSLKGYEKGEGQEFCVKLFQAFGHRGCIEAGAKLEYRIKPDGQHTKFADLVWRPRLLLEMKSRGEKLEKHHQQVFEYWNELKPKPRYVILCNFDEFWIYDTQFQIEEPVNFVKLEELPKRYEALNFLFSGNQGFNTNSAEILAYENIPPNGVLQFVGREDEVKKLDELLQQQHGRKIAVIVGIGGVGKTEFAKQYALRHLQNCRENKSNISTGGVCWLDSREGDIARPIVSFARSFLNLNPPEDWDIPTQLNYCWRNWQTGEWLIVIDDVTDYGKIKPYLPPESSQFTILLTRRQKLGSSFADLQLETLQPQPALDLLKSLVGAERIEQELEIAEKICSWLGYLPLGLELVGRYLDRDPDLSLKTMFSLLEKKRLRHKSITEADATMTAKLGLNDAIELSWERLDENAQELGCMLSLFALADIPWELVKQAYQNLPVSENEEIDLDIVEEARGDLLDFNLLERTGQGSYRVHPLIREFLRDKLEYLEKVDDFKQGFVHTIVDIAKQFNKLLTIQQVNKFSPIIPHIAEVENHQYCKKFDDNLSFRTLRGLAKFYISQGLYKQAELYYHKCLFLTKQYYGLDHPSLSISIHDLAETSCKQGRYSEAEDLCKEALKIIKYPQEQQINSFYVSEFIRTLAVIYYYLGKYSEAEMVCKESLALLVQYSQERKKDEFTTILSSLEDLWSKLALIYEAQNRYSEAEDLYIKAIKILEGFRAEGENEVAIKMIYIMGNLGLLYKSQSRYSEAECIYLQVIDSHKYFQGENHPDLASYLNNLAELYHQQGRYKESEKLHKEALDIRQKLLGDEHPLFAQSLNNLALLYHSINRHKKAETLCERALKIYKASLGKEHPDVALTINNLAMIYEAQGRYDEAEKFYYESLEMNIKLLGEHHRDVATNINNLGGIYLTTGRYNDAERLFMQALEIDKRILGDKHHEIGIDLNNLAMLYFMQQDFKKAENFLKQSLDIYQEQLGSKHTTTIESIKKLEMIRTYLKSAKSELPNFKHKSKKGNSQNKPKGFGKK
ncbi:tetratricopeptide repeat protein [Anabaena cylindrica FACHB-243]|uniref:NB-ARC domain protein n=1 Tax=Anabaena cylindrica (strain ATCC 27899 / PCC 7122) TaxID=272123 RepID=K9ZHR1_ANACC|nr:MULTISPECIES: tetratricopeptide repeat protein [Anabaena]AFZ58112.1 NB-ARC domain protein [Anabaena cylindrica PCC 7122]MBD2419113.1 tetratricopeptide repeat protein [Anabaena cylindrica FACHB-243]MBY5280678.1 tetratricopeptide repeat protein [Anabaena sp. CCAP 1446/1C]MBY5310588.1 tetratricopeptide repeat protein [Anabaena sp. CCAP 1446/1C]MCM2409583.1 tetratricopeptide repeat protein [Anabaena sp. CCAP 1446/1C]